MTERQCAGERAEASQRGDITATSFANQRVDSIRAIVLLLTCWDRFHKSQVGERLLASRKGRSFRAGRVSIGVRSRGGTVSRAVMPGALSPSVCGGR